MDLHHTPFALEMAFVLGALHALEPGHGKTALLVYLADGKKSPLHSIFLGVTSGCTHTLSILAFAAITHFLSHSLTGGHHNDIPLSPLLMGLSGIMMIAIGFHLIRQKWRRVACCPQHGRHCHVLGHGQELNRRSKRGVFKNFRLKSLRADGSEKTQRIQSVSVSALLGVSGGLLPCPSALATYLSGMSRGNTVDGFACILMFAVGIAVCLSILGVFFRYANSSLLRIKPSRLTAWLGDYAQGVIIMGVGVFYVHYLGEFLLSS